MPVRRKMLYAAGAMTDLEQTIRALAAVAFLLYLTARIEAFGLSQRMARRVQRLGFVLFAVAMAIALWATFDWFVLRR